MYLFSVTTSLSSSQQPFHFSGTSGPLECALFRKGEKGTLQIESRGQRAVLRKAKEKPRKTRSSGLRDTVRVRGRRLLLLGSVDLPLLRQKQVQVASFQTLLIILRAKSHQEARGEWLQVTKELHPEGQTSCFSHQAAG